MLCSLGVPQGLIRHSQVLERDVAVAGEASEALQRVLSRSMSIGEVWAARACCALVEHDRPHRTFVTIRLMTF